MGVPSGAPSLACLPSFNAARKPSPPVRETSSPRCVYLWELFMFRASEACRSVVNSSMDGAWDIRGGAGRRRAKDTWMCAWFHLPLIWDTERERRRAAERGTGTLYLQESLFIIHPNTSQRLTRTQVLCFILLAALASMPLRIITG